MPIAFYILVYKADSFLNDFVDLIYMETFDGVNSTHRLFSPNLNLYAYNEVSERTNELTRSSFLHNKPYKGSLCIL